MTYTFHEDGGHGWLAVPIKELTTLGIADKITSYSYVKGDTAYLEEDCDLSTFFRAKGWTKWADGASQIKTVHDGDWSRIRNYQSYQEVK